MYLQRTVILEATCRAESVKSTIFEKTYVHCMYLKNLLWIIYGNIQALEYRIDFFIKNISSKAQTNVISLNFKQEEKPPGLSIEIS